MTREVIRWDAAHRSDFFRVHCEAEGTGWCHCVAWWVPTWDGWGERTAEQNRQLREALCDRGEYDGYLLHVDGAPAGWCQAGLRDRLEKLVKQYRLTPDPAIWAITCFLILPGFRRRGHSAFLLQGVLDDLRGRGAKRVEAYPKRGQGLDEGALWTGAESLYRSAGFEILRDDSARPVLSRTL